MLISLYSLFTWTILEIFREGQQRFRATKDFQSLKEIAQDFDMYNIIDKNTILEIKNTMHETFGDLALKVNTKVKVKRSFLMILLRSSRIFPVPGAACTIW